MKRAIALVLFAATVFTLAACAKKGERYVEPPTEVFTFDNGGRAVYEVVTDQDGEPQTDEEGMKVYRPYDPPLTEKGGYLVTDAEGSTIKSSADIDASVSVNIGGDTGVIDDVPTNAEGQTGAQQPANAEGQTDAEGRTIDLNSGGKQTTARNETTVPQLEHASTVAYNGTISQGKANKLLRLLDGIENPFEDDLVEGRYEEAKESIKVYIANIHAVQKQIQADPEMYAFVTKSNIEYWNYYLTQMERKYGEFAAIVGALKPDEKPGSSVYTSYVAFQDEYRKEIEVYYSIYDAAKKYAK